MTKSLGGVLAAVAVAGCAGGNLGLFPTNNASSNDSVPTAQVVTSSWRGRPVLEMESHPVFSTMERKKQEISDGSVIWHHVRCVGWQDPSTTTRTGAANSFVQTETTTQGQKGEACCDRQFVVKGDLIQEYRQVAMGGGTCTNDMKYAAGSR